MRVSLSHVLGLRPLLAGLAVVGLATTASAATLSVYTTDTSNVVKNTFYPGETILLKVTGDAQGAQGRSIFGQLNFSSAITDFVSVTQGDWFPFKAGLPHGDGFAAVFNQYGGGPLVDPTNQIDTSVITLVATGVGISQVTWGGTYLDFFGIYSYPPSIPTGHTFAVCAEFCPGVPEPVTAALVGLGLIGLGGWRRGRA